ncbi:hypothetical protein ACT9ST_04305 [Sphingobium limneticum]|jgi:hypothetical protein|uniref:hypothetical protein n=2 Tax=Sphingomonadaceae TaxID=41297 RepID=UPI000E722371|nr:hypothetical protein [Sphingobium limneticum]
MPGENIDIASLEAMLAATAPPRTPAQIFEACPGIVQRIESLEPLQAIATFSALSTEPGFGSNLVRLDMATRLALARAQGDNSPSRSSLFRLLNSDLADCGVSLLEDPPEHFFMSTIATRRGPYRLFQGIWEKAAAFSEDMLEAFGQLPPSRWGAAAFDSAYALLTLSDLLAHRAGLKHNIVAEDKSAQKLELPKERQLSPLATRVLISWADLERLELTENDLAPFFLDPELSDDFLHAEPGDSELERQPLIAFAEGILVVAPHNLSTALRAHLIETAVANGASEQLRRLLLDAQSERIALSGFAQLWKQPVEIVDGHPIRQLLFESAAGCPLHILQIVDGFDGVPPARFGPTSASPSMEAMIGDSVAFAHEMMAKRAEFRKGLSIVLLGGWGRSGSVALASVEIPDWEVIALEPADASAIAFAGIGMPVDMYRLHEQLRMVEAQGFFPRAPNGWMNLCALWQETDQNLIPEHLSEIEPPLDFNYPGNLLLSIRTEAAQKEGRWAFPLPNGRYEIVSRLDREDYFETAKPSYIATSGLRRRELLGVVVGRRPVWLEAIPAKRGGRSFDTYETWKAAIHWLEVALPKFDAQYPGLDRKPVSILLEIDWPPDRLGNSVDDATVLTSITTTMDRDKRSAILHMAPEWQHGLHRANNFAEMVLAASMLEIVSTLAGGVAGREELLAFMTAVVGSDDIRWRHSFVADRPLSMLKAHGLIDDFNEIPDSASALARCGSTFLSRDRSLGFHIVGADQCFSFLMEHHGALMDRLISNIRGFDRVALVDASIRRLTAALAEEQMWQISARAMRAAYGAKKDFDQSLKRRSEINAVIRGASILIEMGSCEAALSDGVHPGAADIDDLLAQALLIFQTAEIVPPFRAGFLDAEIKISPTGNLLYDHDFTRTALVSSVHAHHFEHRQSADKAYRSLFETGATDTALTPALEAAVQAEYALSFDQFASFSGACAKLAIDSGNAVLKKRWSELLSALADLEGYVATDLAPALKQLTLGSRSSWSSYPKGAGPSDFDVSRFDRHFSLIRRPIVALDATDDPYLLVSPVLIERAALHNLAGALQGGLQGRFWSSPQMRSFVGAMAERTGLDFNVRAAEAARQSGARAFDSVPLSDALQHKGTDTVKRLGDIDILAFSQDGLHAWVIEAKDIRFCRTLGETTSRLSEYRGQTDSRGRRDNLRKHLDRVDYVRAHAADLAKRYALPATPTIHGLVLFDSPQPMKFMPRHASPDAQFMMLDELASFEWSPGKEGR